jgi:hypothetical protein
MELQKLSEADKHLIYGLLLKKKRSGWQERKVLSIVRSSMELDAKIIAIQQVTRAQIVDPDRPIEGQTHEPGQGLFGRRRQGKPRSVLVVDARAEIAGLLKKSSLKRHLFFSRVAERYEAVHLIPALRVKLIIVNETLSTAEEYSRYFEICSAVEPGIRIIFLGRPSHPIEIDSAFEKRSRFLPKPLNFEKLEEYTKELLGFPDSRVQG